MDIRSNVLALDDDEVFLTHLKSSLAEKFNIITATNSHQAYQVFEKENVDAILLDYALPGENGHFVLDTLRMKNQNQPVIVLSGMTSLEMTVGFLKRRVFGFLEKPISLAELEKLLTEATSQNQTQHNEPEFEIAPQTRKVKYDGNIISLTPTEYEILIFFINHRGRQVSRTEITTHLWGDTLVSRHTFDTHLLNLKKKLPAFANKLISIYGTGYCYEG